MPVPSIFGIGARIQPAIERAKNIANNVEREIRFSGRTLKIFDMTPSGETEILSLDQDWKARRAPKNFNNPDRKLWTIEIENSVASASKVSIGATMKLVKADLPDVEFEITNTETPHGNLGVWIFEARMISS